VSKPVTCPEVLLIGTPGALCTMQLGKVQLGEATTMLQEGSNNLSGLLAGQLSAGTS
jgi:hypothetical protein